MTNTATDRAKNLIVYKASAGSGKTFTLVSEYLALAIGESLRGTGGGNAWAFGGRRGTPAFGRILAITFTNKATGEMKMRILNTLYNIANGKPDARAYIEKIIELLGGKPTTDEIVAGAKRVLTDILHNYDRFDIKTIDSFYQNIISNIAFMVGYHSNLEVYLEDTEAISDAVESIVNGVAFGNNKKKEYYLNLLNKYIDNHIEEDSFWDFRRGLKDFGRNICREVYMMNSDEINDFFDEGTVAHEYISKLQGLKCKYENTKAALVDEFLDLMSRHGVGFGEIKQGGYLEKYLLTVRDNKDTSKSKTGENYSSTPEKWIYAKSSKQYREEIKEIVESALFPAFVSLERNFKSLQRDINSVEFTLANMNEMRMLSMIDEEVKRESKETNRILLSKSQELIKGEVRSIDDITFVFEQAGKRYRHIMIDEAQDTSRLQWENMRNFLLNVISDINGRSVIVGDIKQSIYRWRNSDWTILANLEKNTADEAFKSRVEANTLEYNYRSEQGIVNFNSVFFDVAARLLNDKAAVYCKGVSQSLADIFRDVSQHTNKTDGKGYIQIDTIVPRKNERGRPLLKYNDAENLRLQILAENIEVLHAKGVPYSLMAILVRRNSELASISVFADEHALPFKISTNEAYNITNSHAVALVVAAMKFLCGFAANAEDTLNEAFIAREYQRLTHGEDFDAQAFYTNIVPCRKKDAAADTAGSQFREELRSYLPVRLTTDAEYLSQLPIHALCLELISILEVERIEDESAYIYTFIDYVDAYSKKNAYDLDKFLDDWDAEAARQKISATDADGIRAMTIHSAKGLEFHTVLMPFCDWELIPNKNGNLMWCIPAEEPYNEVPLMPIDYKAKNAESIYAADYYNENFNILVDNLNTLYVAFTRAKANLFVEFIEPTASDSIAKERISNTVADALADSAFRSEMEFEEVGYAFENPDENAEICRLTRGKIVCPRPGVADSRKEHFSLQGEEVQVPFKLQQSQS